MIKHEEIKEKLYKLAVYLLAPKEEANVQLDYNEIALILSDIKYYFNEQEKVAELLGLYRRAINNIYVNDTLMYDLIQKANKLEKELGEIK